MLSKEARKKISVEKKLQEIKSSTLEMTEQSSILYEASKDYGATRRVVTDISDRDVISTLCDIIESVPLGVETGKMRKYAKKLKIPPPDMLRIWFSVLVCTAAQASYIIVESSFCDFIHVIEVEKLVKAAAKDGVIIDNKYLLENKARFKQ